MCECVALAPFSCFLILLFSFPFFTFFDLNPATTSPDMRINIEVPLPSKVASTSQIASVAPPSLVRLAPSGELVLIELQGSLEIDDAHPEGGQALAKLEFHKGREVR